MNVTVYVFSNKMGNFVTKKCFKGIYITVRESPMMIAQWNHYSRCLCSDYSTNWPILL